MDDLVSTAWLENELKAKDLCIVDASQHDFEPERNAREEYEAGHIPGALYLDLDSLFDSKSSIPNMMPGAELFSERMRELGIDDSKRIVIYDDSILKSGLRAWYMFHVFGLENVSYLDGGLAKWKKEARKLQIGIDEKLPSTFFSTPDMQLIENKESVLDNLETKDKILVDGRGAQHFTGSDDDPDPNVASGHIPGSINIPFWDLFNQDGTFKDPDALKVLFDGAGVDANKPAIASCGAGVVACALIMSMKLYGKKDVTLYDGSWSEWGRDSKLPKAKGSK